jgi:hypothetical protein
MLDWLPDFLTPSGRLIIPDYKTAEDASTEAFTRSVANYGYDMQAGAYTDAAELLLNVDPVFVFIVQERTPPYLVNVIQLDDPWLKAGRARNAWASRVYAECTRNNRWPGYGDAVEVVHPPTWLEFKYAAEGLMTV